MRQKKDILFLCQFFHPEYISSAKLPYETVLALKEAGFRVGVMCGYPREYYKGEKVQYHEDSEGFTIHRLRYIQTGRKGILGRLINYFSFTLAVLLHIFEIGRYRCVAVYSNPPIVPWIAAIASRLFTIKLVFVCYDAYPEVAVRMGALREGSVIYRLMNHINRLVFSKASAVVALSEEMKEFLSKNREIEEESIRVIPNWSDDSFGDEVPVKTPYLKVLEDKFVVAYFGNMGTAQDMQTICDAAFCLKDREDIHFLFAGHGNKKEALNAFFADNAVKNVTMLNFLQGQEFQEALAVSNAALVSLEKGLKGICVPSKTYTYMMYGLPLLAVMEDGDIADDIASGAGIRVAQGESRRLAQAIADMAKDAQTTKAMGQRSRALYLQKYTKDICTQTYVRMFKIIL